MLKVIKSNVAFSLILLLSIPAYSSQHDSSKSIVAKSAALMPAVTAVTQGVAKQGYKAVVGKTISKLYGMVPSWQTLTGTTRTGLSWTGTGFSTIARKTLHAGQAVLGYVTPAINNSLAYVSPVAKETAALIRRHPKLVCGTLLATGMVYALHKIYRHYRPTAPTVPVHEQIDAPAAPAPTPNAAPIVPAPQPDIAVPTSTVEAVREIAAPTTLTNVQPTGNIPHQEAPAAQVLQGGAPSAPAHQEAPAAQAPATDIQRHVTAANLDISDLSDLDLLQRAKVAAETDIAQLIAIREAGKAFALLATKNDAPGATESDEAYLHQLTAFKYKLNASVVPENQKALHKRFATICQQVNASLIDETNCCDDHKAEFDEMIEQLNALVGQLEEAIALEMSKGTSSSSSSTARTLSL